MFITIGLVNSCHRGSSSLTYGHTLSAYLLKMYLLWHSRSFTLLFASTPSCAKALLKTTYSNTNRLKENTISKLTHKEKGLGGVVHLVRKYTPHFFLRSQSRYCMGFVALMIDLTVILILNIALPVFSGRGKLGEFTCSILLCNGSDL
jgi:hypothetical protein